MGKKRKRDPELDDSSKRTKMAEAETEYEICQGCNRFEIDFTEPIAGKHTFFFKIL